MAQVRLNKLLSQAGAASRRSADELLTQGRVEVNGHVVTALGTKADPEHDDVRVDGRRLRFTIERRYLLMNKPRGVLSSRSDPHHRKTVIDLVRTAGITGYFYPVGRLDYESEGLILITNDGTFADRVTHPRYELERTYEAMVSGIPDERDLERLRRGVPIEGRLTKPAEAKLLRVVGGRDGTQAVIELTLREGRNRQVRHMCDAIAHPVDHLKRTRIGGLSDPRMKLGQMRDLTPAEVRSLVGPGHPEETGSLKRPGLPRSSADSRPGPRQKSRRISPKRH